MVFNFEAAIREAASLFDEFKAEMDKASDPEGVSESVVEGIQTVLKQGNLALGATKVFGGITIPADVKEHVKQILSYFLNDEDGAQKLTALSDFKDWDFVGSFKKLDSLL